jgi:hypothetical protein
MSDERNSKNINLEEWRDESCQFKSKSLKIIQNNLGGCSNKAECARNIFDTTLDKVSAKTLAEIEKPEHYFNRSATRNAWKYAKKCFTCHSKEYADEAENTGIRRNGRAVSYDISDIPPMQKDAEDREQRLDKLICLRDVVAGLSEEEKSLLSTIIVSNFENKKIFSRQREIDPTISPENVRTKKCRLLKKLKDLVNFYQDKRKK